MILRVAIFIVVVISAQALQRPQPRGDTGSYALGRASSCIIKSRAVRFDDEVISGRQSFGQNGGLYIPPTTDADDDDDEEEEEPDVEQQDQPEGAEDDEEQEQYDVDDEDAPEPAPQGPPLFNLAALFQGLAGAAGAGGAGSAAEPAIPQRPPILPSQYFDPDEIDTAVSATSAPEQFYGNGPIGNYGGGGGGGGYGHGGGCRRCYSGGKGGKGKGGKGRHKKRRRGNINCIIITKDKKHHKPHKHRPLTLFGIPITSRRRRSMARRLRALKLE